MKKRALCLLLAALFVLMVGCSASNTAATTAAQTTAAAATAAPAATTAAAATAAPEVAGGPGSVTYPLDIKQDGTITYWKAISGDLIRKEGVSADNGTEWANGLIANTGLQIDFINPAVGQELEQFNLLLASGDLPDIIEYPWLNNYNAGPDDAIQKGLVYDMTDTIEQWAPDFLDFIRNNGELDKKFKTDAGKYWGMGFIRESSILCVWRGPVVRNDLVTKYGLTAPETIEDWTNMLTVFRDNGVEAPFSCANLGNTINDGAFCAWGAKPSFYQEDGKVVYGPIQEGFKDVLMLLRTWYADGLVDKNFLTNDGAALNTLMGSGKAGATIGNTGGGIGAWTPVLKTNVPDGQLVAAKYPTVNKGETAKFGQQEQDFYAAYNVATINPKSKNIEACVKLLNYGYTPEGDMYMNYGQEGKSYDMVNGYPTMKEEIAKAKDNKAEWSYWARSPYSGIMIQREPYLEQLLVLQEQKDALKVWQTDAAKTNMPPVTQSVDEGSEFKQLKSDIDTYYDEFCAKFIIGEVPETAYEDEFVPTIKSMNIDRAVELRQAALDRYNAR